MIVVAIGNDHAGLGLKQELALFLQENNKEVLDFGTNSQQPADYPDYADAVVKAILEGSAEAGVLVCGTGIGMSIAANRHKGIRAALCHDVFSAAAARRHNNANILVMGARVVGGGHAKEIAKAFFGEQFSGEARHSMRLAKL